ncbi:MAG TPA: M14 family zinc carboxypeptidase [Candidatus Brocadiia bacterium]|nr:M14 family zinc carboxypeptidase [Candidatus Brocadiia bacterium]
MSPDPISQLRLDRPDLFQAPPFWRSTLDDIAQAARTAARGQASVIGRSAGGRDLWAFAYGPFEPQKPTTTISSANASDRPQAFYDPALRTRPVLALLGPMHGGEVEGVALCLNLIHLLEHDADLLGRPNEELLAMLRRLRLVIVPCTNPDGREKAGVLHMSGAERDHIFLVQQGLMKDGSLFQGRRVKELQPIPNDYLLWRGGYYSDAGVNLQHDDFFGALAPENRALAALFRREMPDGFLTLHSHGASPGLTLPDAFLPPGVQRKQSEASFYMLSRLTARGWEVLTPDASTGPPWSFYFQTFLHHVCGAMPLLIELPHGVKTRPCSLETILDIGMTAVAAWADYALRFGLRPASPDFYGKPPIA